LYGSNGYSVGSSLTWADLLIFDIATALFAKKPDFLEKYPLITGVHKTLSANQRLTDYVKNRPVTPF
jgi:glutathione S-transferase